MKKRKIQHVGDSYYVALPPKFVRKNNLKKGDQLLMEHDETTVTFKIVKSE